jgi:hypothetical protein
MSKKYAWSSKAISEYYYEVDTGKIVGQYCKTSFSDEIYHALVNGDNLGTYISYKCAREAVEKQIAKNDADDEALRNHPLYGNPETL